MPPAARADVEIDEPDAAIVRGGARVGFDGLDEGLAWPALEKAVGPLRPGDVLTLQVARSVPILPVLRAAWTLRRADLRLQSQDSGGTMRVLVLPTKPARAAAGCHLAVFLRADGSLRVASPGGPVVLPAGDAPDSLARSLQAECAECPIKYVAFGAESEGAPFGPVFDLMLAVDRDKSAGEARYVLGQAMHAAKR